MSGPRPGTGRPIGGPPHARIGMPTEKSMHFRASTKRLFRRMRSERLGMIAVVLLSIASIAFSVIGPKILGRATDLVFDGVVSKRLPAGQTKDEVISHLRGTGQGTLADTFSRMHLNPGHGIDFGALRNVLLIVAGLYIVSSLFGLLQGLLLNGVVQRTIFGLRSDVEDKLNRLPLNYFDTRTRGEILSRVTNDIDNVSQSLQQTLSQLLTSLFTVIGVLVMMFVISPLLAIVGLVTVPLSFFVTSRIAKRSQKLFIQQWRSVGELNGQIEETFTGHSLVKVFGRQAEVEERFRAKNEEVYRASYGSQFVSGIIMPSINFIGNLNYVLLAVVGGLQVSSGAMSLGNVQAFIQYSRQFTQPLTQVASMANTMQSGIASAERVFELLDAEEMTAEPPSTPKNEPTRGRVSFENVSFSYAADQPLIENLSLVAEPGQTIAIVGPTGAGKTTLVNLIMRFYEIDSGRITLDGVDIATMPRQQLRSNIGMVLQDTWLFEGTVRENLRYGNLDATEEQIHEAAEATFVDRFVHSLTDGYDTVIDDEGTTVSAGEKQLLTIARAFLSNPALLILDEATSSVDTRTEVMIQRAMAALRSDRTSFVIAHRLSTIRDADLILVMEHGSITEQGNHEELLARNRSYARLYNSQFAQE